MYPKYKYNPKYSKQLNQIQLQVTFGELRDGAWPWPARDPRRVFVLNKTKKVDCTWDIYPFAEECGLRVGSERFMPVVVFKNARSKVLGGDREAWTYDVLGQKQTMAPESHRTTPQRRVGQIGQITAREMVPGDRSMEEHAEFLEQALDGEYRRAIKLLSEAELLARKAAYTARNARIFRGRAEERQIEERDFPERTVRYRKTAAQVFETSTRAAERAWVQHHTAEEKFREYLAASISHSMIVNALYPATLKLCERDDPHPTSKARLPLHKQCWKSLIPLINSGDYGNEETPYMNLLRRLMYEDQWTKNSAIQIIREFREALFFLSKLSLDRHLRAVDPEAQSLFESLITHRKATAGHAKKEPAKLHVQRPKVSGQHANDHVA